MKFYLLLICGILQVLSINSLVLPKRLPKFCSLSHPNYNECTTNALRKMGPHLLKGVREINFPRMYPLNLPLFLVNRSISDTVSVAAAIKDIEAWGWEELELKSFKFDTQELTGEMSIHLPYLKISWDFDVLGRVLSLVLDNSGHMKGNFTNLDMTFKFGLTPVEKLGVKFYEFKYFLAKGTIEDGHLQLFGKTPQEQAALDVIQSIYNQNPRLMTDAVGPIFDESLSVFYRGLLEPVLNSIPAEELLPQ